MTKPRARTESESLSEEYPANLLRSLRRQQRITNAALHLTAATGRLVEVPCFTSRRGT